MNQIRTIARVVIAVYGPPRNSNLFETAARLAARRRACLDAIFIEDSDLLDVALLPFSHEFDRSSGVMRKLERPRVERELRSDADQVRRQLESSCHRENITVSMEVVRGRLVSVVQETSTTAGIVIFDQTNPGWASLRRSTAPIWLVYSAGETGNRAMDIALELCAEYQTGLNIILPTDSDKVRVLQDIEDTPGNNIPVRFQIPGNYDTDTLLHLANTGCTALVTDQGNPITCGKSTHRLVNSLRCPLIVVA